MPPSSSGIQRFSHACLAATAGLGLSLLSALPAAAHGVAAGGLIAGASHPLLGLDHLLLLLGVGGVAAQIGNGVLLFALAGALGGAVIGAIGGNLPGAELLAALAVSSLGLLMLRHQRRHPSPQLPVIGGIIAAAVAIHALLHGQEASGHASWWLGAFLGSASVVGISTLLLRRAASRWTLLLAGALSLAGVVLVLAPLA